MNKKSIFFLSSLLIVSACNPTTPVPVASPTATPVPVVAASATPAPVTTPTPVPVVATPTPAPVALIPLVDNYRLTINGKSLDGSKNTIYNKVDEPAGTSEGRIQMASAGLDTVVDGDDKYSFRLTIMTGNMNTVPTKFNQGDFSSVMLEVIKESKTKTTNYKGFFLTGNKEIPLDKNSNNALLKGLKSNVMFETFDNDNPVRRYKGTIEAPLVADNEPILNVKFEWNYLFKKSSN
ncbi:MAG: hypothetical protein AABZ74_16380 [Cyanobacteriota bacterium]